MLHSFDKTVQHDLSGNNKKNFVKSNIDIFISLVRHAIDYPEKLDSNVPRNGSDSRK